MVGILRATNLEPLLKPLSEQAAGEQVALEQTVRALLAVLEARDVLTYEHSLRMADLSVAIAVELGLKHKAVASIRFAGLLHDIGMVAMPIDILRKPQELSIAELAAVTGHPVTSYAVLRNISQPLPMNQAVLQHHERLDGTGYPSGLKGSAICQGALILAVADTVESMLSDRPYRETPGLEAALEVVLIGRGLKFDPVVVDACVRLLRGKGYRFPQELPSFLHTESFALDDPYPVDAAERAQLRLF